MGSAVCTLFERDYHFGVAALVNSLVRQGFVGEVYAGYRGNLPHWASGAQPNVSSGWHDASMLNVSEGVQLHFLPLRTEWHLTNYKPEFMLRLVPLVDQLFYFDPDLVVVKEWPFFSEWLSCGVALCEDINPMLPENHPRRVGWRRYFGENMIKLRFRAASYVNGGCVGISAKDSAFLEIWQKLTLLMGECIGGLKVTKISGGERFKSKGFADCFDAADQDALNATIEAFEGSISIIGQEAMGFRSGAALLPHAQGGSKPWAKSYIKEALGGTPPTLADRAYWENVSGPVQAHNSGHVTVCRSSLRVAAAIGRFIRRA